MSIHYTFGQSTVFCKTKEQYGGLSNMAGGYPIRIGDDLIRTSEHLYQALKYTDYPEVQRAIIAISSPMEAKMHAKTHKNKIRSDWDHIKLGVMEWCLNLKLLNNIETFGNLLLSLEDRPIVELSKKDDYWGAIPRGDELIGTNMLGRLLCILSKKWKDGHDPHLVPVITIPNFYFEGKDVVDLAMAGLEKI